MGFINNTSYILNAVLTKKGREYLARPGSNFSITKFALSDDEIDYTLWNHAHPKGNDYYGAVLESTPMLEPNVDPEVVMKYKLINLPVGERGLPYIENITPTYLNRTNALETGYNPESDPQWTFNDHYINPDTAGSGGVFDGEKYSFLVLNQNVVDIGTGQGKNVNFDVGAIYGEETGRLSKKIVSNDVTIRSQAITAAMGYRETSIIITGQQSGAVYVLPVRVNYKDLSYDIGT